MARLQEDAGADRELERKEAELSALRARHAAARAALQRVRDEISQFEEYYDQTLGRRVAELDRLETEIARFGGEGGKAASSSGSEGANEGGAARFAAERPWQSSTKDIKSLYREVAKTIHPDISGAGPAGLDRHELMSKANRAYAEDDRRTLQEILKKWWSAREEAGGNWAALVRVNRQIAREREALAAVVASVEALRQSLAFRLKQRFDAGAVGSNLLADLITAVDLNIAKAATRLAILRAETGDHRREQAEGNPFYAGPKGKALHFPTDVSCGTLYIRELSSSNYSQWKKAGPARGTFEVGTGKAVRLDVAAGGAEGSATLSRLRKLDADDLQALFLYDICDADLDCIVHLKGLEELYLSGQRLTDAALLAVTSLTNLERIYIYQTAISDRGLAYLKQLPLLAGLTSSGNRITDEGLAGLKRAMPRVRTVTFQWRR